MRRIGRLLRCGEQEYHHVGVLRSSSTGNLEPRRGEHLRVPSAAPYVIMTKDEAIKRILFAIGELASQGPMDRTRADVAITLLEEVIEALQKRPLEHTRFAA